MSLSRYQLERADLLVTIEEGRRVEGELFAENHRSMQTMGELLKARMFGATEYAIQLRKRMTNYVQGNGAAAVDSEPRAAGPVGVATGEQPQGRSPELYPDPHPEHGVLCDCDDCDEAVKRLLRDCGVLPKGRLDYLALTDEPITGRTRVPARYRRDESDK